MQGCNDCILDFQGNLWVTAPAGPIAPQPYARSFEVRLIFVNTAVDTRNICLKTIISLVTAPWLFGVLKSVKATAINSWD